MQQPPPFENAIELEGTILATDISRFGSRGHIDHFSLKKMPLLTARIAKGFDSLHSVDQLWLWCSVTRTAMRHVLTIPGLRVLDVLEIVKPGQLEQFSVASTLEIFRGNHYPSEADVMAITSCRSIRELGIQGAELSSRVICALLDMPNLRSLDIECSNFDDEMAEQVSESASITSLDVGGTRITKAGLGHISRMKQLNSLDLWDTSIQPSDLDLLAGMPNLEYLSVGENRDEPTFRAQDLLPRLAQLPSLKRLWLDGVNLDSSQRKALVDQYEWFRHT